MHAKGAIRDDPDDALHAPCTPCRSDGSNKARLHTECHDIDEPCCFSLLSASTIVRARMLRHEKLCAHMDVTFMGEVCPRI